MKYLKKINEIKHEVSNYSVIIIWEVDGNKEEIKKYYFNDEEEINEFLQFIWEIRNFEEKIGYDNLGYFKSTYEDRLISSLKNINNFDKFIDYLLKSNELHIS